MTVALIVTVFPLPGDCGETEFGLEPSPRVQVPALLDWTIEVTVLSRLETQTDVKEMVSLTLGLTYRGNAEIVLRWARYSLQPALASLLYTIVSSV